MFHFFSKTAAAPTLLYKIYHFFSFFFIRVLPSVFANMAGQFPSCATIEPEIEGTWEKFINNDGLEIGDGEENF